MCCRYTPTLFWHVAASLTLLSVSLWGQVNLSTRLIQYYGPQKNKLSCGIRALQLLPGGSMLVGSGEGTLSILQPSLKRGRSAKVSGAISSIALSKDSQQVGRVVSLHQFQQGL